MDCFGSWFSKELIKQLDIRERASRHHSVVASAGPVGVELTRSKAARNREAGFISDGKPSHVTGP